MFGLNKYAIYGIIFAVSMSIFSTFVLMWRNSIRQQALLEANNKQLTQIVKDQELFIKQLNEIYQVQRENLDVMNKKNDEIKDKIFNLETFLTPDNKDNRPSSEVLRETIRRLREPQ